MTERNLAQKYFYKCWIETDCFPSPTNCDWHEVTYKYDVECFDCHSDCNLNVHASIQYDIVGEEQSVYIQHL